MKRRILSLYFTIIPYLFLSITEILYSQSNQIVLKKYDGTIEGLLTVSTTNGANDYFAVRYSIPSNIQVPYKILRISFYNNDSQTSWPKVLITHGIGNSPNLSNPVAEFNNVSGPTSGFLTINTDILMGNLSDIFFILQLPPGESFSIPGGTGTGAAIGADGNMNSGYQAGNLFSTDGSSFSELNSFNLGVELTIEEDSALPVELSSFNADINGRDVALHWVTQTETSNFGFAIERSPDGLDFIQIGFIEGKGTTTVPKEYSFGDKKLEAGVYYYRLRQIDYDGTFSYSSILKVRIAVPSGFKLEQNYPNPFNPETSIAYEIPADVQVCLSIYNLLGQKIRTLVNKKQTAGYYINIWNGLDNSGRPVSSGTYIYELRSHYFIDLKQLTLIR